MKKMKKKICSCILAGVIMGAGTFALSGCDIVRIETYVDMEDYEITFSFSGQWEGTLEEMINNPPVFDVTFTNISVITLRYTENEAISTNYAGALKLFGGDGQAVYGWDTTLNQQIDEDSYIATFDNGGGLKITWKYEFTNFPTLAPGESATLHYVISSDSWYHIKTEEISPIMALLFDRSFSLGEDDFYQKIFTEVTSEEECNTGAIYATEETEAIPAGYYSLRFYSFFYTLYVNVLHVTESTETTNG